MSTLPQDIYKSTIRTVCVVFGALFNNITVREYNPDGSVSDKRRKVEIAFAPKENYALWIDQGMRLPDGITEIGVRFPRLSFDMVGLSYDSQKQLNPWVYHTSTPTLTGNKPKSIASYSPAAYTFNMQLSLWAKDMDTSIQVLDQILPYFKPEVSVKVKEQYNMPVINDFFVELTSINKSDNYASGYEENRMIQWDMDFTVSANIWQNNEYESNLIKEVLIDFHDPTTVSILKGMQYDTHK